MDKAQQILAYYAANPLNTWIEIGYKLILRSLDGLTEKEIEKFYQNKIRSFMDKYVVIYSKKKVADLLISKDCVSINTIESSYYLRSIGVDSDGLIDKGWAIRRVENL